MLIHAVCDIDVSGAEEYQREGKAYLDTLLDLPCTPELIDEARRALLAIHQRTVTYTTRIVLTDETGRVL